MYKDYTGFMNKEYQIYMGHGKNGSVRLAHTDTLFYKYSDHPKASMEFGWHAVENTPENREWLIIEKLKGNISLYKVLNFDMEMIDTGFSYCFVRKCYTI